MQIRGLGAALAGKEAKSCDDFYLRVKSLLISSFFRLIWKTPDIVYVDS